MANPSCHKSLEHPHTGISNLEEMPTCELRGRRPHRRDFRMEREVYHPGIAREARLGYADVSGRPQRCGEREEGVGGSRLSSDRREGWDPILVQWA